MTQVIANNSYIIFELLSPGALPGARYYQIVEYYPFDEKYALRDLATNKKYSVNDNAVNMHSRVVEKPTDQELVFSLLQN